MKIVFCCSEVFPFAKTGGMGDVCGALPLALEKLGQDISIIMPKYRGIEENFPLKRINSRVLTSTLGKNIKVFFLVNDRLYDRPGLYGDRHGDYPDNLERFQFLCKSGLALIKDLSIPVDVVHCHDWQTALVPVYLKNTVRASPTYKGSEGSPAFPSKDFDEGGTVRASPTYKGSEGSPAFPSKDFDEGGTVRASPTYKGSEGSTGLRRHSKTNAEAGIFADPAYAMIKTVFSIHNLAFQGVFPKSQYSQMGLDISLFQMHGLEYYDQINLMKGGILFTDVITTVSPTYAKEIQTRHLGCGLDGVLRSRKNKLKGILNGLDYDIWNPETDPLIEANFSSANWDNKAVNKLSLQNQFHLPQNAEIPVFGFVARLSHQKGIDLILDSIKELMRMDLQIVVQGTGDRQYEDKLKKVAAQHPQKIGVHVGFQEKLAHQIYAGSDLFLMPSVFEPCGLSQMISLRYGTIPLVFYTGGLADTVTPFSQQGNGFVFYDYAKGDFLDTVNEAVHTFHKKKEFSQLIKRAFKSHFSWEDSAKQYIELYKQ